MAGTAENYTRRAGDKNVSEFLPILIVAVDHERDARIGLDIFYALEFLRGDALGLFVERREKTFFVEDKTDWNHMRPAGAVRSGEMGDAGGPNETRGISI